MVDLPLTARRFLASLLPGLTVLFADEGKSGAKVLILDDRFIVITVIPRHPDKSHADRRSVTSLSVKPVTFLSVIYSRKSHRHQFWKGRDVADVFIRQAECLETVEPPRSGGRLGRSGVGASRSLPRVPLKVA